MRTSLPISLLCGLLALVAAQTAPILARQGLAAEVLPTPPPRPVEEGEAALTVRTASGRTFTARIDARTDHEQLWLRWQRGSAAISRPIDWDQVIQVHVAGQDLRGEEFREAVHKFRQEFPTPQQPAAAKKTNRIVIKDSDQAGLSVPAGGVPSGRPPETPRIISLSIEAGVGRWNSGVEVDGLVVRVYPLDCAGAVVPARGTLEIDLIGRSPGTVRLPPPFQFAGRWEHSVRPADFGPDGAVYRLRFQDVHPEFDPVSPHGLVHAKLSVPGQGTFEASAAIVRIRPYSAVRDRLEAATGHRFFPIEATDDGRR